jgi:non-specific serine/threonine protein kinase
LALLARQEGDYAAAQALLEDSLTAARLYFISKPQIAQSLHEIGLLAFAQGDHAAARAHHRESLEMFRDLGNRRDSVYSLRAFVDLAAARGDAQRAARLLGASESLRESMHLALSPTEQQAHEASLAALRQALGEPGFTGTWEAGRALTWEEAVAYALKEEPAQ